MTTFIFVFPNAPYSFLLKIKEDGWVKISDNIYIYWSSDDCGQA